MVFIPILPAWIILKSASAANVRQKWAWAGTGAFQLVCGVNGPGAFVVIDVLRQTCRGKARGFGQSWRFNYNLHAAG
jgi:hypothetical protein